MKIPIVDLKLQHETLKEEICSAMLRVVQDSNFILGSELKTFEEEFAHFCGAEYGIGVGSGTAALHLALLAAAIGPGDEVITVPNTFISTALAISYVGATPRLVDIDPDSYNIDVDKIEKAITKKTKAVIPVHLYGQAADMDSILKIASKYDLKVIEDACQAHGAEYKNRCVGSIGDIGCFSFYPGKNLGALGDGGMIVTNSDEVAREVRLFRHLGQGAKYYHLLKGFNSRLDTLQAAVLSVKLARLSEWNERRNEHAEYYNELLNGFEAVITPRKSPYATRHVYHIYAIRVKNRKGLQEYLLSKGISTGIHYPIPIHMQEAYGDLGYKKGDFPVAEEIVDEVLSLPMYPELTRPQIQLIANEIKEYFQSYSG